MVHQPAGALHGSLLAALGSAIVSGEYPPGQVFTLEAVSDHEMVANIQAIHRAIAPFIVVDCAIRSF